MQGSSLYRTFTCFHYFRCDNTTSKCRKWRGRELFNYKFSRRTMLGYAQKCWGIQVTFNIEGVSIKSCPTLIEYKKAVNVLMVESMIHCHLPSALLDAPIVTGSNNWVSNVLHDMLVLIEEEQKLLIVGSHYGALDSAVFAGLQRQVVIIGSAVLGRGVDADFVNRWVAPRTCK